MKKVVLGLASLSLIVFLGACSSEPKSMEYFKDSKNEKELKDTLKYCKDNRDSILKDKTSKEYIECENAFKADVGKSMGKEPLDSKELLDEGREKANALFD
ncbi:EexN family lipoprotein [Campylobacter sp. RKI_CA19_01128]|uniref:EexN family lipoprotein n=1 Tax=unclassified Campylobacter TaxID=2593542 RepID=UPI0021E8D3AD|nr:MULTISPECIES: EexN family lipoprotein [unclassified Campylobacter]MCV3349627.1 EexN family lipoprotein [Campylobacter sp. RKI_CA19_01127]MCV3355668.1 EexN family lipoprotein [Campylobacter sp. RKI_CA19_01128]HEC1777046.1 EexN family lipoprotein [Campylobacter lari]